MKRISLCAICGQVCGPSGCPEHGEARVIKNIPLHNALAIMVDLCVYERPTYALAAMGVVG